jgi:stress response protein YsnF
VTKRIMLRERVIVRKETVTRLKLVQAELRREHIDIHSNDDVDVIDER